MIPAKRAHLYVAARSHPGMVGKNNEDRFAVTAYRSSEHTTPPSLLAVVCDGIGGHRAGEIAAEIAVDIITKTIAVSDPSKPLDNLQSAVKRASQEIYQRSVDRLDWNGMGATCACAWVIGDQLYTVNVGDSRIYLLRNNTICQITLDHTWIQEALDNGLLTPEQARDHPNSHVIRRYLGSRLPPVADFRLYLNREEDDTAAMANQGLRLLPGDRVLLCTDGLTDLVNNDEILTALEQNEQPAALDKLVQLANQRGGRDNITVVALQMPDSTLHIPFDLQPENRRLFGWAFLGISLVLLAGMLVLGGFYGLQNRPTPTIPAHSPVFTLIPSTGPLSTQPSTIHSTPTRFETRTPPATARSTPLTTLTQAPQSTLTSWPTNTSRP